MLFSFMTHSYGELYLLLYSPIRVQLQIIETNVMILSRKYSKPGDQVWVDPLDPPRAIVQG